ncbi:MAG: hypothetical protein IJY79_06445 [Clostridia bacterium]|nr:hypothetical protein [Clostridia bacterium]
MNNDIFENAFGAIDDELIAEAKSPAIRIAARRKKIIISAVAACVAAILVAIPSVKVIGDLNDNKFTESDDIEVITEYETVYENASSEQSSSNDIKDHPQNSNSLPGNSNSLTNGTTGSSIINDSASGYQGITITTSDLFSGIGVTSNGGTTSYQKTYVPDVKYLYIKPIPEDKYVTVYEYFPASKKIYPTEQELRAIAEKYLPKFSEAIGIPTPEYTIKTYAEDDINVNVSTGEKNTDFYISDSMLKFGKSFIYKETDVPLTLYGETVAIDQTKSDEEIIASLSGIKEKLGKLFETTFTDPKITRRYSSYHTNGADWIYVYFKSNDNSGTIQITFDNFANHADDIVSSTILYNASIYYFTASRNENSRIKNTMQTELLPLQKAEEYLSKGYVLSMGGCPLCQAAQTPVDFSEYDYVGISNFTRNNKNIPYYEFYKNIGISENGNMTFAYTYVPAVEVEGYEEYFENKHANH